jgi:hypothetical protein
MTSRQKAATEKGEMASVEEYRRAKDEPTGEVLLKAMQDARVLGLRIKPARFRSRVRCVKL